MKFQTRVKYTKNGGVKFAGNEAQALAFIADGWIAETQPEDAPAVTRGRPSKKEATDNE